MAGERDPLLRRRLAREDEPPRSAPPVREHALLGLQRAAGNAAVARMLTGASRRTVQRKIGFELEAGEWESALLARPLAEMEHQSGEVSKAAKTTPPDARKAFYESGNVRGTADELPGTRRDVEFVIKERDEGEVDAIAGDFDRVEVAFGQMHGKLPGGKWMWPERRLGWSPPDPGVWLLDNPSGDRTIQLQATAGLPLERIGEMMEQLYPEADPHQDELGDPRKQTGMHPGAGLSLAISNSVAFSAVVEFVNARGKVDSFQHDLAGLVGLTSLMAQLVVGGNVPAGSEDKADFSYPKAMAHLLPRTDFAHMFGLLPQPLQEALKADDVIDTNQPAFVSLIAELCTQGDLGSVGKPVLGWSKWKQIEPGMIVPDLTRELWARGILVGQDRMSQSGYLEWLKSRKDTLSESDYEKRTKESDQLDSIGAWKGKMDAHGDDPLPLVEFRALVLDNLNRDMTIPEAKAVAVRLANYVKRIVG
jgi:hypothetical protein